jgi:hypothetical protein
MDAITAPENLRVEIIGLEALVHAAVADADTLPGPWPNRQGTCSAESSVVLPRIRHFCSSRIASRGDETWQSFKDDDKLPRSGPLPRWRR